MIIIIIAGGIPAIGQWLGAHQVTTFSVFHVVQGLLL
jgi:hypothetical protein